MLLGSIGFGTHRVLPLEANKTVRAPLPAPTILQAWQSLQPRLRQWAYAAKNAQSRDELHEWYWDGACEELSDQAAFAFKNNRIAQANFESLTQFDMDCGGDQSAAAHMLAMAELSDVEIQILRGILHARLRIMNVQPAGEFGLQKAIDRNSGNSFWVETASWPTCLEGNQDHLVRLVSFPSVALWVGPCLPIPNDREANIRKEAEEMLASLMRVPGAGLRGQRESSLVDFSHQWAEHWLESKCPDVVPTPPFTLLRGA